MRFEEIMKLPFTDANQRPIGEVVRDYINRMVRESVDGEPGHLNVSFMTRFNVPEHEIKTEDLLGLVAAEDCFPVLWGRSKGQKLPE